MIIFDNLSSIINTKTQHMKPGKNYINDIYQLARRKEILVVYLNPMKYSKGLQKDSFFLEPENYDVISEFMSSIFLAECNDDFYNTVKVRPLKSKYGETDYWINLENYGFIIQ